MLYPLPSGNSVEPDAVTCVYAVGPILYVGLQFGQSVRATEYTNEEIALGAAKDLTREINALKTPNAAIKPDPEPDPVKSERCHWCDEETNCKDFVQAVTGRVFCTYACWNTFNRNEGFKP